MLYTTQCQKPLPVGASGSYAVTAKLFVPAGAPAHWSAGDTFCPEHPKVFATWRAAIVPPGLRSGLVRVKRPAPWAAAGVTPASRSDAASEKVADRVTRMTRRLLMVT